MSTPPLFKIVIGCFFALFFMIAIGMGITAFNSGAPLIIAITTIGMGSVALLFGIAILSSGNKSSMPEPPAFDLPTPDRGDYLVGQRTTDFGRKIVFQVPSKCPDCGANLSEEDIEWVGPLQARCPYCSATVDAKEREL